MYVQLLQEILLEQQQLEQLTEWANRSGVPIISNEEGADPASVYDGFKVQR